MKLTVERLYQRKEILITWNKFVLINPTNKATAGISAKSLKATLN
jgi:regulator of sigma D